MKMLKTICLMALVLVVSADRSFASDRWTHFLPFENVRRMQYDAVANTLWFGTDNNGLWRYDGRQFEHITLPKTRCGIVTQVTALAINASQAELWVGTPCGLFRYHLTSQTWDYYDATSGLSVNEMTALYLDSDGTLWYGSYGGGAGKLDNTGWDRYTTSGQAKWNATAKRWEPVSPNGPASNFVDCIAQDQQGKMYFGTREAGLCILNKADSSWHCLSAFLPKDYPAVTAIAIDRMNNKWLGTFYGVYWLDSLNTPQPVPTNSNLTGAVVETVWIESYSHDTGDIKWFGTSRGVSVLDSSNQSWKNFTNENSGLASNEVRDIIGDHDGNLWFAFVQLRGASRLNNNWSELKTEDGLPSNFTLAVAKDRRGRLWVGTDLGGAEILSDGKWLRQELVFPEECPNIPLITAFLPDGDAVWVASQCGVFKLSPNLLVLPEYRIQLNNPPGFRSDIVWSLAVRQDTLWAGTDVGLARVLLSSAGVERLDQFFLDGLSVLALAYDHLGSLYAGTDRGLYVFNGAEFLATPIPGFDPLVAINAIARDPGGAIWVGTDDGLARFDSTGWTRFSTVDGLPDKRITAVAVSPSGVVWCGTINGVAAFTEGKWTAYSTADGLSDNFVLDLAFGPPEAVWFATYGGGVARYRKTSIAPETYLLETFKIVTEPNVTFHYSGYDINTAIVDLRYQYALDNNSQWSPATSDTNVTLHIGRDGPHTFYVRAIDKDGNIDPSEAKFYFHKLPSRLGDAIKIVDATLGPKLDSLVVYVPPAVLPLGSTIRLSPAKVDTAQIANANRHLRFTDIAFALDLQPQNISLATNTRPITLKIFYHNSVAQKFTQNKLAIYQQEQGQWIRRGGNVDAGHNVITTTLAQLDTFALFEVSEAANNELALADLGSLAVQPRMLSPEFAQSVTISFDLGKPTEVTAKVYNLAGRLVQVLRENHAMNPGRNTVEWNGNDYNGKRCSSGMYLICVQANGRTATKTVMVVNR